VKIASFAPFFCILPYNFAHVKLISA